MEPKLPSLLPIGSSHPEDLKGQGNQSPIKRSVVSNLTIFFLPYRLLVFLRFFSISILLDSKISILGLGKSSQKSKGQACISSPFPAFHATLQGPHHSFSSFFSSPSPHWRYYHSSGFPWHHVLPYSMTSFMLHFSWTKLATLQPFMHLPTRSLIR